MAYSEKVVDHYNNPRNIGSLPKDDKAVGTGIVGAPECGDVMKLQIKVENDVIVDEANAAIPSLMEWCQAQKLNVETIEEKSPPFDDVFIKIIKTEAAHV